ncbi:hypothetical protein L1987_77901 [Smallanthus sonchifolius]|uniref:Uncharacterized protein n=1 Tax=Smallanthus sonchifolius TaxID=185202 RepID=A0ACB8ZBD1_9ASTR|nr:hypothetical protein L1987_77901 [Smallanthus sonchifolius]
MPKIQINQKEVLPLVLLAETELRPLTTQKILKGATETIKWLEEIEGEMEISDCVEDKTQDDNLEEEALSGAICLPKTSDDDLVTDILFGPLSHRFLTFQFKGSLIVV